MSTSDVNSAKEKSGIQSLERAFAIMEYISQCREGIGLAELSKAVGLHSSTTFHLCKTLLSLGYIRQASDTKRYRIGRMVFTLAANSLDEIELVSVAMPTLEDLAHVTGESSHLAMLARDDVVIVARTAGTGPFQLTERAGVVRPAHCTAIGKVLLATLPPARLEQYLATNELQSFTPNTITERERLLAELAQVRSSRVAFDDGEYPEVRCISAPVRDFTGKTTAALGVSGPIWRLSNQALHEQTRHVKHAALRLSAELGWRDDAERSSTAARSSQIKV
jgi:DNA-binding IclR family transcriptional regulator